MFEHKCKSAPMARGGYLVEEVSNNMVQRALPYFCQGDVVLACHVDSPSKDVLRNPPPFVCPQNTPLPLYSDIKNCIDGTNLGIIFKNTINRATRLSRATRRSVATPDAFSAFLQGKRTNLCPKIRRTQSGWVLSGSPLFIPLSPTISHNPLLIDNQGTRAYISRFGVYQVAVSMCRSDKTSGENDATHFKAFLEVF